MKSLFTFSAKVWRWPGNGGWHFVNLPKEYFEPIRTKYGKGMIPILVTIGKTFWQAKLFPHLKEKSYLLAIKKSIRKGADIWDGDTVEIKIKIKK